jgi:type II secretory pathway component PulJ
MSKRQMKTNENRHRSGYTLLEVILALGLTILLLGGITMAINYHLVTLRQQQDEIERSQVARQSLFLITKDIRAAIQYKPIETSALNELIESISSSTDAIESITGEEFEEQEEVAQSQYAATRPGLYGTATELQIDVSRLPRVDQYSLVNFSDGTSSDIPSDVKTVSYFVRSEEDSENGGTQAVSLNDSMGLVRRSLDRAVTRYAADYGGGQINVEDYEEVLAREVSQIEFRYWDQENEDWVTEWDSDEMLGLPKAVEISVAVGKMNAESEEEARKIYRTVVYLPVAELIPPEEEEIPVDESGDSGSSALDGGASGDTGGDR